MSSATKSTWLNALIVFLYSISGTFATISHIPANQYSSIQGDYEGFYDMLIAIFSTNPVNCLAKLQSGHVIIQNFTADCSDLIFNGTCEVAITQFKAQQSGQVTNFGVFFRHPHSIKAFTEIVPTTVANMPLEVWGEPNEWGQVGKDYLTAFNRIWQAGLQDYVYELWSTACNVPLVATGHSAGGGLAQLFAMHMVKIQLWDQTNIYVFSYGTPRIGDPMFAAKLFNSVYSAFRIVFLADTVPQYPPTTVDRTQPANINQTGGTYMHYGYTIWYSKYSARSTTKSCSNPEDPACDDQGTNITQHYEYFGYKEVDYDARTC